MIHDPYFVKTVEYLTGLGFLVLFVVFWNYVMAPMVAAPAYAHARAWSGDFADWFRVPERLFYHPGHAWLRPDADGFVTIGVDDFAQQLVGPIAALALPQPGLQLKKGAGAWNLGAAGRSIPMVAPVDGVVMEVNPKLAANPGLVNEDPYGLGWLLKVKTPDGKPTDDLLTGDAATRWMRTVANDLTALMTPRIGQLAQDGGTPIHGLARGLDEEHWDEISRRFLLS